jgi:uncharacterized membrane protein
MLAKIASWVVRLGGLVMIVLGLLFWTGNATNLVNEHMTLGMIVVLALWLLAGNYASRKGANVGLAAGAFLTGIVVLGVGMTQTRLLPGSGHIIIEVLHFLLGLTLISFGEIITGRLRRLDAGASVATA